jgi:hypothetical protein
MLYNNSTYNNSKEETYWLKQLINDPLEVSNYKLPYNFNYLLWDLTFYNPNNIQSLPKNIKPDTIIDHWTQQKLQKGDVSGFIKDTNNNWIHIGSLKTIQEFIRGFYYKSTSKRVIIPEKGIYIDPSDISWFKI